MKRFLGFDVYVALFLAVAIFAPSKVLAAEGTLEERIELLEARSHNLELSIQNKLSDCTLEMRRIGRRTGWCPRGSVVTEAELLSNSGIIQLTCSELSLRCKKSGLQFQIEAADNAER